MSTVTSEARPSSTDSGAAARGASSERVRWRQLVLITLGAVAVYITMRLLPTGTNLNHMDFRVQGTNSIEFCDPLNPQFIPVVAARSPVTLTVSTTEPPVAGRMVHGVLTLRTSSGKPIAPEDLLEVHTKLLHLMIVDPTLTDYQHVHPEPRHTKGEWAFSFSPRRTGVYRLFADFTPVATARGLYANTDLQVAGRDGTALPGSLAADTTAESHSFGPVVRDGYKFELTPAARPIRARQPMDLTFRVTTSNGGVVPMQPIMGAYAHLVAFDSSRSGFAHLHPVQVNPLTPPDATHPLLNFKLTIPAAGRYVIWSQVNLGGHEVFVPFWFDVQE